MTVFGGKLGKNAPNMAFFGALHANRCTSIECTSMYSSLSIKRPDQIVDQMGLKAKN